jgi:hypothetical protein
VQDLNHHCAVSDFFLDKKDIETMQGYGAIELVGWQLVVDDGYFLTI